jgi:ribonucleotide reductase alpha subunit
MSHTKYEFISELYKNILESKYCLELTDPNKNKVYKENFQDAIYRVAHEVNKYDKNKFAEMKQKTIQFISNKDFSPAGGIWRAAGNPSSKVSFVNCTTQAPVKDSIENIFGESLMNWSRIASYGQGNGIDISGLRPRCVFRSIRTAISGNPTA